MKATKKHISLETAKLLKDCGIDSEKWFFKVSNGLVITSLVEEEREIPAFSWGEILYEYPKKFFGRDYDNRGIYESWGREQTICERILDLLQQKKYEEADLFFRENCIKIKK